MDGRHRPVDGGFAGDGCTAPVSGSAAGKALFVGVTGYLVDTCTITAQMKVEGSECAKITGTDLTNQPIG